jgi:hypothetical protein
VLGNQKPKTKDPRMKAAMALSGQFWVLDELAGGTFESASNRRRFHLPGLFYLSEATVALRLAARGMDGRNVAGNPRRHALIRSPVACASPIFLQA